MSMPNYCWNYLEAPDGDFRNIQPYISIAKESELRGSVYHFLDFEKILPMPEELKGTESPKDKPNWYDWAVENWGTKWNSFDGNISDDYSGVGFVTAWSPPIPVISALAKKIGKRLRLIYDEPGMDFCGECIAYPDGTFDNNEYSPRADAPDNIKEDLSIEDEE